MRRTRHLKPREIQGCQLALDASIPTSLYDATSGGSPVAADGAVARWEDQSGNSRHATQSTGSLQPIRKLAVYNGQPTIRFDSGDWMTAGSFLNGMTVSVFAVARRQSNTDFNAAISAGAAGFDTRTMSLSLRSIYDSPNDAARFYPVTSTVYVNSKTGSAALSSSPMANPVVLCGIAGNTISISRSTDTVIGAFRDSLGAVSRFNLSGDLSEVFVISAAVSNFLAIRLSACLQRKWRISG